MAVCRAIGGPCALIRRRTFANRLLPIGVAVVLSRKLGLCAAPAVSVIAEGNIPSSFREVGGWQKESQAEGVEREA